MSQPSFPIRRRTLAAAIPMLLLSFSLAPQPGLASDMRQTSAGRVEVERMVSGLVEPWAIAFLPGGSFLITERDGRLLHFTAGRGIRVANVPYVWANGQGGLLDVVAARDFATSRTLWLSYAEPRGSGQAATTVAAARLSDDGLALEDVRVLLRQEPPNAKGQHFGSRIVEAPDGKLFVTLGERGEMDFAQRLDMLRGKVVRINRDGSVPADNPFVDNPAARPEIWSLGHRNPQGAGLDLDGRLVTVEHGAKGGDEVNYPEPGLNYGWPVITYGVNYDGRKIGVGTHRDGLEQPAWYWDPSIAPSGLMVYSGRLFPDWKGNIFIGSLKFDFISRLELRDGHVVEVERLLEGDYARIRDIREAPDGSIWFLSVGDGAAYRITPGKGA